MVSRMSEIRYPMKMVTQRTGLSAHVLRVWERRYEAVNPDRTGSNRRLYSEEEVRRLEMMAKLTRSGHSIGQVAKLETAALQEMVAELSSEDPNGSNGSGGEGFDETSRSGMDLVSGFIDRAWKAVGELDSAGLEKVFEDATQRIGGSSMIENVIVPLTVKIGEGWDTGEISVAQERAASTVIQEILLIAGRPHSETSGAPNLLVATPVGQLHELGASLVVCMARRRGWEVTYLGPSIPADEIAHAAKLKGSCGVALSIVYPSDDPGLQDELKRLRRLLDDECEIIVGGRAAAAYSPAHESIGARQIFELGELKDWLDNKRKERESG